MTEPYQLDLFEQPPCRHCKRPLIEHERFKCLLEATEYAPGQHSFKTWREQAERLGNATTGFAPYEDACKAMEQEAKERRAAIEEEDREERKYVRDVDG